MFHESILCSTRCQPRNQLYAVDERPTCSSCRGERDAPVQPSSPGRHYSRVVAKVFLPAPQSIGKHCVVTRDRLSPSMLGDNQPAFSICAIAFFISLSLTSLTWVMTDHSLPKGSSNRALRSP